MSSDLCFNCRLMLNIPNTMTFTTELVEFFCRPGRAIESVVTIAPPTAALHFVNLIIPIKIGIRPFCRRLKGAQYRCVAVIPSILQLYMTDQILILLSLITKKLRLTLKFEIARPHDWLVFCPTYEYRLVTKCCPVKIINFSGNLSVLSVDLISQKSRNYIFILS